MHGAWCAWVYRPIHTTVFRYSSIFYGTVNAEFEISPVNYIYSRAKIFSMERLAYSLLPIDG